ncbi:ABC transporter permease [Ruegeria marina]|uniref:ABC-type polysaccharide/polyol phosphate export permease n=1 Tax=Ruegeria marina TaxID=639004 RepID=A0A1G6WJX8_9RHOB|nr:ABC-type polysaccharide/polyol phosphate export permease [Ruegeria marina]
MFKFRQHNSLLSGAFTMAELIFHNVVRSVRQGHSNAFVALAKNMMQVLVFVLVFYMMFSILGLRGSAIRGDFLLYIMSGIFLFMVHIKTVGAVAGAEGPNSAMMKHAPMNTIVAILSAALASLYTQLLTLILILFGYHVAFNPVYIDDWGGAFAMLMLSWFTGFAVGLVFLSIKPWAPTVVGVMTTIYQRANMIASGKMFVANTLPGYMLAMFDWNPLFHAIDQCRGFVFKNYFPHNSDWHYALWVGIVLIMIGLMGEFYTRRHVSASWYARR